MTTLPKASDLLPHRPPFAFIDEVLTCEASYVRAVRAFRPEEDFFRGHFPGRPIVPGVLLVEAMAQAFAYWGLMHEGAKAVYLTGIDRARFRRPVVPGDRVELEVRIEGSHLGIVSARAEALVAGRRVAEALLSGRFE
jgi:3-hydroxyacyl-[acyl-carrier-protein] dehydratase